MTEPKPPVSYKIIRGTDWLDLADAVNTSLAQGWVLAGGVTHVPVDPMTLLQEGGVSLPYWQALYLPTTRKRK